MHDEDGGQRLARGEVGAADERGERDRGEELGEEREKTVSERFGVSTDGWARNEVVSVL